MAASRRPVLIPALLVIPLLSVLLLIGIAGATAQPPGPPAQAALQQIALGAAFTYQGQLQDAGSPVNGACDFRFGLWDSATGGNAVGTVQNAGAMPLTEGLFTVALNPQLEFGDGAFEGAARWLEIAVRCPAGVGDYTTLSPRQGLSAAPYALYAPSAGTLQRPGYRLTIAESTGNTGQYSALAIGNDGFPLISYQDATNTNLKVLHCADLACTLGTANTVDDTADAGYDTSIAIGADGLGLIAYRGDGDNLQVAHCSDLECTSAVTATLGGVVRQLALTIGADDLPLISYFEFGSNAFDLGVVHCSNVFCLPHVRRR
jgi:hypothetical protein